MQPPCTLQRTEHPHRGSRHRAQHTLRKRKQTIKQEVLHHARVIPSFTIMLAPSTQGQRRSHRGHLLHHSREQEQREAGFGRGLDVLLVDLRLDASLFLVLFG